MELPKIIDRGSENTSTPDGLSVNTLRVYRNLLKKQTLLLDEIY